MPIKITIVFVLMFSLMLFSVSAVSNSSIEAKNAIDKAQSDMNEMQSKAMSIERINDSLQQAIQLYNAQMALEEKKRTADYSLILKYALDASKIKEMAIKANDEIHIFRETYTLAQKDSNLSEMEKEYAEIELSFKEERFEDTLKLIDKGYDKIADIQSGQTTLRLFYSATSKNLKSFFQKNWLRILIILAVGLVLFIILWKTIKKSITKKKLNHLILEKQTLSDLIKKLQTDYFKLRKISESEYKVKTEHFKEMIRDIERQIPLLREELLKLDKKAK